MSTDFAHEKTTARDRLQLLLSDLLWHRWSELARIAGVRYSARILELKRLGFKIESQGDPVVGKDYRLTAKAPGKRLGKRVKVYLEEADAHTISKILSKRPSLAGACKTINNALGSFRSNKDKL